MNKLSMILKLLLGQTVGWFVLFGLALFLPAGTLAWPAAWVFLGMFFTFFLGTNIWLFRHNPALLQERAHLAMPDQKGWDRVFFPLLLVEPFFWLACTGFDRRWRWSAMPLGLQALGGLLLLVSFYLLFLTFRENSYLSTVVRIQEERGHNVISSGPYHYVRHPMYAGFLIFALGATLLLGSWYGLLPGLGLVLLVARRAVLEERVLRQELDGYSAYMRQVPYRMIPGVW